MHKTAVYCYIYYSHEIETMFSSKTTLNKVATGPNGMKRGEKF